MSVPAATRPLRRTILRFATFVARLKGRLRGRPKHIQAVPETPYLRRDIGLPPATGRQYTPFPH